MRKLSLLVGLALISCLASFTFGPGRHPAGPGAIEDMIRGMFKAIDANDRAATKDCIATDSSAAPVLVYDLDLANRPITCEGTKATHKYLDGIFDAVAKDKVQLVSKVTKIHAECYAQEFGYATFEFTHEATAGGKTDILSYRTTALVSYSDKDKKWRIFHWHSSLNPSADAGKTMKDAAGAEHKPGK